MKEEKYKDYAVEEFVLDDEFRKWVVTPDLESDLFWESFLKKYPDKRAYITEAKLIVRSLQPVRPDISEERLQNIFQNVRHRQNRVLLHYWRRFAAGIALLIGVGTLVWFLASEKDPFPFEEDSRGGEKGRIILSDGSTREFDTESTVIRQMSPGMVTINNDTVRLAGSGKEKVQTTMNRVVIPYGKRSEVTLSDGTRIRLNSGSQLSYPSVFKTDLREVYLSGEAFFEVSADKSRPFYVVSGEFSVKVLGTRFNVTAYPEDPEIRTVLLEGKVSASRNRLFAKEMDLSPGEGIVFDKAEGNMVKGKVDTRLYTSWINGYLLFENEPTVEVFKKLERYYNRPIKVSETLSSKTFSGKLDLKDDIRQVLDNISFASSLEVMEQDSVFTIK
jgi:ferric-dicitrate binding protein FerR (iron transport regulator)